MLIVVGKSNKAKPSWCSESLSATFADTSSRYLTGDGYHVPSAGICDQINPAFGVKLRGSEVGDEVIVVEVLAVGFKMILVSLRLIVGILHAVPVPANT